MPTCHFCDDTGVIDTGNNDLPCTCSAGELAVFNVSGRGTVTGEQLIQEEWRHSPGVNTVVRGVDYIRSDIATARVQLLENRVNELESIVADYESTVEEYELEVGRFRTGFQNIQIALESTVREPHNQNELDAFPPTLLVGTPIWAIHTFYALPPGIRVMEGTQGHVLMVDYEGEVTIELVTPDREVIYEHNRTAWVRWSLTQGRVGSDVLSGTYSPQPQDRLVRRAPVPEAPVPGPSWHSRLIQEQDD